MFDHLMHFFGAYRDKRRAPQEALVGHPSAEIIQPPTADALGKCKIISARRTMRRLHVPLTFRNSRA